MKVIDHLLKALSEFVKAEIPLIGDAASLLTVCSNVRSIAVLEYGLSVRLIEKAPDSKIESAVESSCLSLNRKRDPHLA